MPPRTPRLICTGSLKRLGTSRLNLFHPHRKYKKSITGPRLFLRPGRMPIFDSHQFRGALFFFRRQALPAGDPGPVTLLKAEMIARAASSHETLRSRAASTVVARLSSRSAARLRDSSSGKAKTCRMRVRSPVNGREPCWSTPSFRRAWAEPTSFFPSTVISYVEGTSKQTGLVPGPCGALVPACASTQV